MLEKIKHSNLQLDYRFINPVMEFALTNLTVCVDKKSSLIGSLSLPIQIDLNAKRTKNYLAYDKLSIRFSNGNLDSFINLFYKIKKVKNTYLLVRRKNFFEAYNWSHEQKIDQFYQIIIRDLFSKEAAYLKHVEFLYLFGNPQQKRDAQRIMTQYVPKTWDLSLKDVSKIQPFTWIQDSHFQILEKVIINHEWNILHHGKSIVEVQRPQYIQLRTILQELKDE